MIDTIDFQGFRLHIYRDDKKHRIVSGNKLHKLKPSLAAAKQASSTSLISFGGPYSNHLHALAFAAQQHGFKSIGLVRGELHDELTPCLRDCQQWGMQLQPIARTLYRSLQTDLQYDANGRLLNPALLADTLGSAEQACLQHAWVIPEGGSHQAAVHSVAQAYAEIFKHPILQNISHALCATGTGATVAGLALAAPEHVQVVGVQAVAEGDATLKRIEQWMPDTEYHLEIVAGHLGGFGKIPAELKTFMAEFEKEYDIPLDPVYTAKVVYCLSQLIQQGRFSTNKDILMIHTGGLQGRRE